MTRRIVILILIGFPSAVMLWYMGAGSTATSLLSAWVEGTALLVAQFATLMGFIRPRPYQRRLLEVAVPLMVIFLVFDLLLDYAVMSTVLPGYPLARETVAWYRLRLVVGSACLACYVVGFLLLIRARRWP